MCECVVLVFCTACRTAVAAETGARVALINCKLGVGFPLVVWYTHR